MSDLANELFVPLLAGYLFLRLTHKGHIELIRYDSQRLFFTSSLFALLFFSLAHLVVLIVDNFHLRRPFLPFELFTSPIIEKGFLSIFFAVVSGYSSRLFKSQEKAAEEVILADNDATEILLLEAFKARKPVLIILANGKAYVGLVTAQFFSKHGSKSVRLSPTFAGTSDAATGVRFHRNYDAVYQLLEDPELADYFKAKKEDFQLTLYFRDFASVRLFNDKIYDDVFLEREKN
jgi:hypothetical protein